MAINLEFAKAEFLNTSDRKIIKETAVNYRDISHHITLWAVARAMSRCFLYDSYQKS